MIKETMRTFALALLFTVLALALRAAQPEFKYFRSGAGIGPAGARLPEDLNSASALRWQVPMDAGQSTPIICKGKIFLTTWNGGAQQLATVALDEQTGKVLWKQIAPAPKIEEYHRQTGSPAPATPACDGEHLYVFFGSYGLICYDLSGNKVWENRMGPFRDEYGAGSSPILIDNKVILAQDHDIDSFVMAVDRSSGKTLWKTPRPDAVRSYSTPAVWVHNGRKEFLVAGALELASYDPQNGEKLWSTHGLARIVIPVPVVAADMIYMASWAPGGDSGKRIAFDPWKTALVKWDKNHDGKLARAEIEDSNVLERFYRMDLDQSGTLDEAEWNRHADIFRRAENALLAIKPSTGRGELSSGDVVWKYTHGVPYVASPLVHNGIVWMVKEGGIATKLDAASGKLLQEERLAGIGGYYASPVCAGGKVFFASEQGVVTAVAEERDWKVLSSRNLHEKIYATPAVEGDHLYVRTEKALYCF